MKAETYTKELTIYKNLNEGEYEFKVNLVEKSEEHPPFVFVEGITFRPWETEIHVYDLDRPVYFVFPDGSRRKMYYPRKTPKINQEEEEV